MINSKERVKKALTHCEPDRVPIFEYSINNKISSETLGRKTGIGGGISYKQAILANINGNSHLEKLLERNIEDTLEMSKRIGLDMVQIRFQKYLMPVYQDYGNIGAFHNFNVSIEKIAKNKFRIIGEEGFWSECFYDEKNDFFFQTNDSIKENGLNELRRYVKYLEKKSINFTFDDKFKLGINTLCKVLGNKKWQDLFILGYADVLFPSSSPHTELFLESIILEPELIEKFMDITTEGVILMLKEQINAGVDGIIGANDICSKYGPIISPKQFQRFISPYLKRIVSYCHINNIPYIKHYDGNTNQILDTLVNEVGIDGYHSIESSAGMDIFEIKKKFGNKIALIGNLDVGDLLIKGNKKEIDDEIKKLIKFIAPGGGYIFSTSNVVHSGISKDTYMFVLSKVLEYGNYPINIK